MSPPEHVPDTFPFPKDPVPAPDAFPFPDESLDMLIQGFDAQAPRLKAPLQNLASYSVTLAEALSQAAVAVQFGAGLVLLGAATLLEQ